MANSIEAIAQVQRLRVTYSHQGPLRYVGHLDVVRTWERALRRAEVPMAYSEGYNPQAKLQFASGLPLGTTGRAELMDVVLNEELDPAAFVQRVSPHLPAGLAIVSVAEAPVKTKALQGLLRASEWQADVQTDLDVDELDSRVRTFMESASVEATRKRKGKPVRYDLRSLVLAMQVTNPVEPGWQRLQMTLRSEPSATGRVDAVLRALGLGDEVARIERQRLIFAD
ncbi:MAG: TIGR03936 family radical SAM-associated protein [Caldilineales bacterium]